MSAPDLRPGAAVLVRGEWPARVVSVDLPRLRAVVRWLGDGRDSRPEGAPPEQAVALAALARPHGARYLDPRGTRAWTTKRPWTGAALRTLRGEWGRRTPAEVAALVGRSEAACAIAMTRWWGTKARRAPGVLSMRRAARVLGVEDHRVAHLVAAGLLRAAPSGIRAARHERWAIALGDLEAFLAAHPEHYDRERIRDRGLRRIADAAFDADPVLTTHEAAARLCVNHDTVLRHVRRGWLRAVWTGLGARGKGARGYRLRLSWLEGFQPWPDQAKPVLAAVRRRGLLTVAEAARDLGVHPHTLGRWIRRDRYPAERIRVGQRVVYGVRPIPTLDLRRDAIAAGASSEAAA